MRRPQFTLRALLLAMLVVAAFFGGMALQRQLHMPRKMRILRFDNDHEVRVTETMRTPDGKTWERRFLTKDEPDAD